MPEPTNGQLAAQIAALLVRWNAREDELAAWMAGTVSGGPNSDGRYPLTNAVGTSYLIPCPAAMNDMVEGPAAAAQAAQVAAELAQTAAETAETSAGNLKVLCEASRDTAVAARNLAETYRDQAASEKAAAQFYREEIGDIAATLADFETRLTALENP